jgi:hypothetical protein
VNKYPYTSVKWKYLDIFVQTLTRLLLDEGLQNRILSKVTLHHLISGSDQRRYHLVNRAMKHGELRRITRGLYLLNVGFIANTVHPFAVAQAIDPGSFVTAESALSFHGWIPESVKTTISLTSNSKRKEVWSEDFGSFSFQPMSVRRGSFLELVQRHGLGSHVAWIATPARALMDLVYLNKLKWSGLAWLTESYRIDIELLEAISSAEIRTLCSIYKQKRLLEFLEALSSDLSND